MFEFDEKMNIIPPSGVEWNQWPQRSVNAKKRKLLINKIWSSSVRDLDENEIEESRLEDGSELKILLDQFIDFVENLRLFKDSEVKIIESYLHELLEIVKEARELWWTKESIIWSFDRKLSLLLRKAEEVKFSLLLMKKAEEEAKKKNKVGKDKFIQESKVEIKLPSNLPFEIISQIFKHTNSELAVEISSQASDYLKKSGKINLKFYPGPTNQNYFWNYTLLKEMGSSFTLAEKLLLKDGDNQGSNKKGFFRDLKISSIPLSYYSLVSVVDESYQNFCYEWITKVISFSLDNTFSLLLSSRLSASPLDDFTEEFKKHLEKTLDRYWEDFKGKIYDSWRYSLRGKRPSFFLVDGSDSRSFGQKKISFKSEDNYELYFYPDFEITSADFLKKKVSIDFLLSWRVILLAWGVIRNQREGFSQELYFIEIEKKR